MPSKYDNRPYAYLGRARKRLDEETPEALFYAALELRCGVECRLKEYVAFAEGGMEAGEVELDWQIRKLRARITQYVQTPNVGLSELPDAAGIDVRRELEKDFGPLEDRVIMFTFKDYDSFYPLFSLFYTPVTRGLAKSGERLGELLHSQGFHDDASEWWIETRGRLESIYTGLKQSLTGSMISLPEIDPWSGWPRQILQDEASPSFERVEALGKVRMTMRIFRDFPESELSLGWDPLPYSIAAPQRLDRQ